MSYPEKLQFLAAIRDENLALSKSMLKDGVITTKTMMESVSVSLRQGRVRSASMIWRFLSAHHRKQLLLTSMPWTSACLGPEKSMRWVLKKADITADSRDDAHRPYAQILVENMIFALKNARENSLRMMWDRCSSKEWASTMAQTFDEAMSEDNLDGIRMMIELSVGEPESLSLILSKLNSNKLMRSLRDHDRFDMLKMIYQTFHEHEIDVFLLDCPCGCHTAKKLDKIDTPDHQMQVF